MADASVDLFNTRQQQIVFWHQYSQTPLAFKAFLTSYQETFSNNWEEKELVRRLNKQYTFNAVYRSIQLAWTLPAYDIDEAISNIKNCNQFVRMMYPQRDGENMVVGSNPMWFMSVMNLAHHARSNAGGIGAAVATKGLKGFPSNFSWTPKLEEGVFCPEPNVVYPKVIAVSCDYKVIVDERVVFGWHGNQWADGQAWPWGIGSGGKGAPKTTGPAPTGAVEEPSAEARGISGLNVEVAAGTARDLGVAVQTED